MNKYFSTISKILFVLLIGVGFLMIPESVHAGFFGISSFAVPAINELLAGLGNAVLMVTSYLVTAAGLFLSVSINITLHIKDFYEGIPAIKQIWIVVRDLSSMFIIFILLYYSILTIVGKSDRSVNDLIVKVFLAGIFINFSLFFVRIGVDASNLVSLQFYNAIAPETSQNFTVNSAFFDGGLSNIFLQSLKIQKVYGMASAHQGLEMGSIFFSTIGGIIIMVTAALSIFAAALAFAARTAIILFIMAICPLYFAGIIFPQIKTQVSDRILKLLKGQLIFMPVYLFLLYVALRVISDGGFGQIFGQQASTAGLKNSLALAWGGLFIQYAIAIVFINIPLIAAISLSGEAGRLMKWAPQADAVSKRIGGFFGRNTLGRAGRYAGEQVDKFAAQKTFFGSEGLRSAGAAVLDSKIAKITGIPTALRTGRDAVRSGLSITEKAKYGGPKSVTEREEEDKKYDQKVAEIQHAAERKVELDKHLVAKAPLKTIKGTVSKMTTKELEKLDEKLYDPKIAAALSSKQFENLLKSDELDTEQRDKLRESRKAGIILKEGFTSNIRALDSGAMEGLLKEDFNDEQKKALKEAREAELQTLVDTADLANLPEYIKNLSGKELSKMKTALITDDLVVANLKESQLKEMTTMDDAAIKAIGKTIDEWLGTHHKNHPAYDYINKNRSTWTA